MAEERVQRRLAAILAADVAGYTRLMGADEEGTLAALKAHRRELIDPKIAEYGGRIVKTTGDGALIEFPSVVDAVRCAVDIQVAMADRSASVPENRRILFRVGINLGDIIIDGGDIYGDGVNVAARLEGLAAPGGICVSGVVRDQVQDKLSFSFEDMAEQSLKNVARPVRVFRVAVGAARAPAAAGPTLPDPALPDRPSVAVLPFQNMSGDAEQEFFADGVSEDIITDLSKVSGVFVIGRHSSFVYKGRSVGLRQVGQELGVRYVLEGSVRKAGNRVRITAQLIDSNTDRHVWAERFDRELEDIFAVQEEVSRNVVEALAVSLLPEEGNKLGGVPTKNLEAYDAYLRGQRSLHPPTPEGLARGRHLFERAIELDPAFAGGYAGLSFVEALTVFHHFAPNSPEIAGRAKALAAKAIALDANFGWSHMAQGSAAWIGGNRDAAIDAAREAVRLQPGDPDYHSFLALYLTLMGRAPEAIAHAEHAVRLNPKRPGVALHFLAYAHAMAGNSRIAIDMIDGILSSTYSQFTYAMLILAHMQEGNVARAEEAAQFALQRFPDMTTGIFTSAGYTDHEATRRAIEALRAAGIPDDA